ncbi:MAG: ArnT family glycosyltransferase, partial [Actinomycetota bacterium]
MAHIAAGYSYLRTGEVVLNPMHPPLVKELSAIPLLLLGPPMPEDAVTIRRLGHDVTYQREFGRHILSGSDRPIIVFTARIPAVLLSLTLAALIFAWARELWGPAGGLVALFLYVFDPTITAHAQLVTTDVGFALFATLFVLLLRRYVHAPSLRTLFAAGIGLGLALGAKFSAVALAPTALALVGLAILHAPAGSRAARARALTAGLLAMSGIATLVLWAIYLFPPDPAFYVRGLASVRSDNNPSYLHYLMGDFRTGGWPHYFLVAWLVKTPVPAILAVLLAGWLFVRGRRVEWLEEAFVIVPGAALFVGYSFSADPVGIRYLIPCYPFLFVFSGRIGPWLAGLGRRGAAIAAALGIWYLAEFVAIAPDHLSYFNQIAGGPEGGLAWLDDSNVDWGQGLIQLR